ncbi:MAG: PDZ domain-containing protein [Bacteroidetes bacterium]|nr:PDZ domain-containing protein [Bacteroidota bacterium]
MTSFIKTTFATAIAIVSMAISAIAAPVQTKQLTDTRLGISYTTPQASPMGILLVEVDPQGVAAALGLQANDILLGINDRMVLAQNLHTVFAGQLPGEDLTLRIERGQQMIMEQAKMPDFEGLSKANAFLGIEPLGKPSNALLGVVLNKPIAGSGAEYAGLKKGDILIGIDQQPIVQENLRQVVGAYMAGQKATLRIERNGHMLLIPVVFGTEPSKGEATRNAGLTQL